MSAKPNLQPTLQALLDRDRRGLDEHPDSQTLVDYHAGDLSAAEQEDLRNHLALCHGCADLLLDLVSFAEFTPPEQTPALADGEVESAWQKFQPRLVRAEPQAEERLPAVAQLAERRREGGGGNFVPRRRLIQAYAIAASLLVGVVGLGVWAGSLQKTIEEFRKPLPNPKMLHLSPDGEGGTRGEPEKQVTVSDQESFTLVLDPFDTLENAEYAVEVVDSGNRVVWQSRGLYKSAEEDVVTVGMPKGYLKPGEYQAHLFSMKGDDKAEMKSFHFSVVPEPPR